MSHLFLKTWEGQIRQLLCKLARHDETLQNTVLLDDMLHSLDLGTLGRHPEAKWLMAEFWTLLLVILVGQSPAFGAQERTVL